MQMHQLLKNRGDEGETRLPNNETVQQMRKLTMSTLIIYEIYGILYTVYDNFLHERCTYREVYINVKFWGKIKVGHWGLQSFIPIGMFFSQRIQDLTMQV